MRLTLVLIALVLCVPAAAPGAEVAPAAVQFASQPAAVSSPSAFGFLFLHHGEAAQAAWLGRQEVVVDVAGEEATIAISVEASSGQATVAVDVEGQSQAQVALAGTQPRTLTPGEKITLQLAMPQGKTQVRLATAKGCVRWSNLRLTAGTTVTPLPLVPPAANPETFPPPRLPPLRPGIEQALIEWDWQMQDGLGTEHAASTWAAAIEKTLDRGDALVADLQAGSAVTAPEPWKTFRPRLKELIAAGQAEGPQGRALWRDVHHIKRQIAMANPVAKTGPLVFIKHCPSMFSHQLTQYNGNCARPGGGVFVLEEPGRSMRSRVLAGPGLPVGSYELPDVSFDGRRVLFAHCNVETSPPNREQHVGKFFHLFEINADGSGLRQLTDGAYDDFAGRYLPDGRIVFLSTRRGGFHRCGQGPCPVHTLALCNADGSSPRPISFHETHEWDPSVLGDGRVIYTRWDYVDRNAVFYQQLWSVRPDGSDVRIFYGNNTLNPVGVWEARAVPGSNRVMATAAAHHGMTAGSIISLDVTRGVDGPRPIERLTPDALFPESEMPLARRGAGAWSSGTADGSAPPAMPEHQRWPGHCYKSPWPLSENYFLAAYSFDRLVGEPDANSANMFGIYLVDRFGNKELLYRDPNISSLWAIPLRPRSTPRTLPTLAAAEKNEGTFFMQNVYQSWPGVEPGSVKRLRIVQVLPKSTWHANQPTVGLANASPGKQVLGTVPVEADGSAYFRAPAGVPISFQALDSSGRAVQIMRSVTYLQPGEQAACVGCHERRSEAPAARLGALALGREPSSIRPAPDGANPLSYPLLVQPVLDKHCVSCHGKQKQEGKVLLTGEPNGRYTSSYLALAPRVPYADWAGKPGDFRQVNSEPLTRPGFFGARGAKILQCFEPGHYGVKLSEDEHDRVVTWMDANALFYGTFDPADQARQQRGERIARAGLE